MIVCFGADVVAADSCLKEKGGERGRGIEGERERGREREKGVLARLSKKPLRHVKARAIAKVPPTLPD